jgi:hypothetical protein
LLSLWAKGELTAEQAVGHLVQNQLALSQRLSELEKRVRQLELPRPPQG